MIFILFLLLTILLVIRSRTKPPVQPKKWTENLRGTAFDS